VLAILGVIGGVHAFYYSGQAREVPAEFGRYAFPAVTALAAVAVGSAFAFRRRFVVPALTALVVLVLGTSYASQILTLTGFYS
jgi:hypothetical protein